MQLENQKELNKLLPQNLCQERSRLCKQAYERRATTFVRFICEEVTGEKPRENQFDLNTSNFQPEQHY